ncbi:MAG TPA: hypothetical protein IAB22_01615 [Candidatus Merdivicinus intestinavium]|nr:hypothetical protein [Candidatus Merdivicinus intestinavium]
MRFKRMICLLVMMVFPIAFAFPVFADMGPKPQVTVRVENPPEGLYYLDLLVPYQDDYPNLTEEERAAADPELLKGLASLEDEGWYPALSGGTHIPLSGSLTGEPDGGEMVHAFGYAPPDSFRIILASEEGTVVSDVVETHVFRSTVRFDAQTGETSQRSWWLAYPFQYFTTLIPTLIIEGIVFLLFGFSLKRHWVFFLILNMSTQLLMYYIIWCADKVGAPVVGFFYFFYMIPLEIFITIIEAVAYARCPLGKSGKRRVLCAAAANAASCFAGFFLAEPLFYWTNILF